MPESKQDSSRRGCSMRALITGVAGAFLLSFGSTWNDMMIKGSGLATWNWAPGSICMLLLLVLGNLVLRRVHHPWALSKAELGVAYVLILVANTLTGRGFSSQMLPVITGSTYYATPENDWANIVQPNLPAWLLPQGRDALWQFYEGSPGGRVPWDVWVAPLVWWGIFALALFVTMTCIMVILRKQWVSYERLAYPLVQLPLAMIGGPEDDRDGRSRPLLGNWLLWVGFLIPFCMGSLNALHNYYPVVPTVVTYLPSIPIFRGMAAIQLHISTSMVGFSYFVPPAIAAGLCFFYLATTVQRGLWGFMGWGSKEEALGAYSQYTDPDIIHQAMGAMIILVIGTLWIGRQHLAAVFRKAFTGDPSIDDSDEILSYRMAVAGTATGLLVMAVWLWRSGIAPPVVVLLLSSAFIIFIAISRTVAQGGVANMFPATNPPDFVVSGIGSSAIGAKGMGGLAICYAWSVDTLILMMTAVANGLKLLTELGAIHRHRRLFGGIVAVILVTLPTSIGLILFLGYEHGAINLSPFYFNNVSQYPFQFLQNNLETPYAANWEGWLHTAAGAAVMAGMMAVQHHYLWWPFHPLGYPVSCVFGGMWFSVFVALLLKTTILKYGGPLLLARLRPFFLGLILGEACVGGFWVVVDAFTGMQSSTLRGVFFG